jgi:hypothetical protein
MFGRKAVEPAISSEFVGLKNQGKTCHLNTVLQVLHMTDEFRDALQECAAEDNGRLAPLPSALCGLFEKLQTSSRAVSTKPISATLKRLGLDELNEQQDAHDILLRLIDRLESELKTSKRPKLVNELFEGKQQQYVTCGTTQPVDKKEACPRWRTAAQLASASWRQDEELPPCTTARHLRAHVRDHGDVQLPRAARTDGRGAVWTGPLRPALAEAPGTLGRGLALGGRAKAGPLAAPSCAGVLQPRRGGGRGGRGPLLGAARPAQGGGAEGRRAVRLRQVQLQARRGARRAPRDAAAHPLLPPRALPLPHGRAQGGLRRLLRPREGRRTPRVPRAGLAQRGGRPRGGGSAPVGAAGGGDRPLA